MMKKEHFFWRQLLLFAFLLVSLVALPVCDSGDDDDSDNDGTESDDDSSSPDDDNNDDDDDSGENTPQTAPEWFAQTYGLTLDHIHWGEFHAHTSYSVDAAVCDALSPSQAYAYADSDQESGLDFVGLSDHAEMPNDDAVPEQDENLWASLLRLGQEATREGAGEPDPFIVFPGWEYTNTYGMGGLFTSETGYGHKNVVFRNFDSVPSARFGAFNVVSPLEAEDAQELWEKLADFGPACDGCPGDVLTIVHTPAQKGTVDAHDHRTDWNVMNPDFVRHVEIISKWGNSEGFPPEDAACDQNDEPFDHDADAIDPDSAVRQILYEHWIEDGNSDFILGFVGGTDTHDGTPGSPDPSNCDALPGELRGGITGIVSQKSDRDSLWENLWDRHTQASTAGGKTAVLFAVACGDESALMGETIQCNQEAEIMVYAEGSVDYLEIVINGCLADKVDGSTLYRYSLPIDADQRGYIYVRAIRNNGTTLDMTWTSPVYLGNSE